MVNVVQSSDHFRINRIVKWLKLRLKLLHLNKNEACFEIILTDIIHTFSFPKSFIQLNRENKYIFFQINIHKS